MGAAFVALLLLAGDLGAQGSAVTQLRPGETPLTLGPFGIQVSATSETRVGVAPIIPGADPRWFIAEVVTPLLGLELHRPTFTLQLFYGVRLFWEDPSPISTSSTELLGPDPVTRIRRVERTSISDFGPLVLHSAGLSLDGRPSRTVDVVAGANGSIGSPDYTALPQVLGTVQGALPPIVSIASGTALARIRYTGARRWELDLAGQVFHTQWLDVPESPSTVPGQTSVGGQTFVTSETLASVEPGATYVLTPRDGLGLISAFGEATYSDGAAIVTVTPAVVWKRRLTHRENLRLTLGVTYARSVGNPPGVMSPFGSSGAEASPIGSFQFTSRILRRENVAIIADATGGVDFYFDPVLGTALPRGSASAGLVAISVPHWMINLRGDFATALKTPPLQPIVVGQAPPIPIDETAFSISLAARRRVSENMFAEIGILWADRGPVLTTPDFHFHQRQLWVHISLMATTRPIPRMTQQ